MPDYQRVNVATVLLVLCSVVNVVNAQEADCYGPGSIAGAVIGTLVVGLIILGLVYLVYKHLWKPRREKHLVLETDPEQGDKYAFDNPCFKDASSGDRGGLTPIAKALDKSGTRLLDTGKKWSQWSPLGALVSTKNEKKRTLDDSHVDDEEVKVVSLRSHDFTGLGFNICGNMREGIYIKDVLHRGPASESGKLNPGDRINSVRISFEHMVYEDALTILSYASPYEVQIEARSGFKGHHGPPGSGGGGGQGAEPRHPLYRSSSSSDLHKIGKSARLRLFHPEDSLNTSVTTDYSTLPLSSNNTTLERGGKSPKPEINTLTKPERTKKMQNPNKNLTPEQLKSQLEYNLSQKISYSSDHASDNKKRKDDKVETEKQTTESHGHNKNRFQKFGVRVLPMEAKQEQPSRSPKTAELSQNDNNINLEKHVHEDPPSEGVDEVDKTKIEEAPPVKRREKNKGGELPVDVTAGGAKDENFERSSLNGSGIKRDKAGIPQEIPDHMLQAAVAARKNRKSGEVLEKVGNESEESETAKTPRKQKGKAPAPPPDASRSVSSEKTVEVKPQRLNFGENFDEISTLEEKEPKIEKLLERKTPTLEEDKNAVPSEKAEKLGEESKEYCSDSDMETDNQSSVNTIELNSSDITIHHSEEDNNEMKGRKTASTGDLSKIQRGKKTNTGTLERAQSLDITDSGIPTLTKKRKAAKDDLDSKLSSDESLYEKTALKNKEPRLSLALDGLDTFQRNRLKKSSEWGNLEDVIMNLDKVEPDDSVNVDEKLNFSQKSPTKFDFGAKDTKFGNSITHISDEDINRFKLIQNEQNELKMSEETDGRVRNVLWPDNNKIQEKESVHAVKPQIVDKKEKTIETSNVKVHNVIWPTSNQKQNDSEDGNVDLTTPQYPMSFKNSEENKTNFDQRDLRQDSRQLQSISVEPSPVNLKFKTEETRTVSPEKPSTPQKPSLPESSFSLKAQFQEKLNSKLNQTSETTIGSNVSSTGKAGNTFVSVKQENSIFHPGKSSQNFIFAEKYASNNDNDYGGIVSKIYDTNISDDIKVSRHSLGSLERPKSDVLKNVNKLKMQSLISSDLGGVSNVTVTESKPNGCQDEMKNESQVDVPSNYDMSTASELYTTAIDTTHSEPVDFALIRESPPESISGIKNITITETVFDNKFTESPSSLTIDTSSDGPESIKSNTLTFVTEIQVSTPTNGAQNLSPNPTQNVPQVLSHDLPQNASQVPQDLFQNVLQNVSEIEISSPSPQISPEAQRQEEPLKTLPEMKFTTSSYESPKTPEKKVSQIELLRSNFERSPPKAKPVELSPSKSRIPVPTKLDFKSEKREIKIGEIDTEEREIVEIMSTAAHSTPLVTNQQRFVTKSAPRNVTVTSIRTSSKIPSGQHTTTTYANKPPVPARPTADYTDIHETRTVSSNGNTESSFKHWVFNPSESSVTNIVVNNNNKEFHK